MRVSYIFNHANVVGGELSQLEMMDAIRDQDITPLGIVPEGVGDIEGRLHALGVECGRISMPSLRGAGWLTHPGTVAHLSQLFREQKSELAHSNGARCTLYAAPAAHRAGIQCLWHIRVLERDGLLDRLRGWLCDGLISNSAAVAGTLAPLVSSGKQRAVIPNGISLSRLDSAAPADIHSLFGLPEGPVLLAVGRVSREKGFEVLAVARALLAQKGLRPSVVIVGAIADAAYQAEIQKQVEASAGGKWCWAGPREDIASLMKAANILVIPSHREGFGRVVLEAWACNLPVVASRQGGLAELIQDGVTGLLAQVGNAQAFAGQIANLLTHPDEGQRLTAGGAARVQEFSIQSMAKKTARFYREIRHHNAL